jgi:acyl transferase domain-containing protein
LETFFPRPLSSYIYPAPTFDDASRAKQAAELNDTAVAQPALCTVALVALDLLQRFGLTPDFTAGHSLGEYAALHAAGCLPADDLLRLAALRGKAVEQSCRDNSGGMAAVSADAETVAALLHELNLPAVVANCNAPDQTIIAGSLAALDRAIEEFSRRNLTVRRVPVTAAFHTPMMQPAAEEMAGHLENVAWAAPRVPVFSNATAAPYPSDGPSIQALLTRHFTAPVRFVEQIEALHQAGARFFVEAGAGSILTNCVTRILAGRPHAAIALDAPGREAGAQLAHLLARCAVAGLPVRLEQWFVRRTLFACATSELFAKQRQQAKVPPLAWIVGGHKARPANGQRPTEAAAQRSDAALRKGTVPSSSNGNGDSPPLVDSPVLTVAGPSPDAVRPFFGSTPMKPVSSSTRPAHDVQPDVAPVEIPAVAHHGNGEALAQFQANMASWLDLQKQHQQASQRFLDLQEQALRVLGDGAPTPRTAATPRVAGRPLAPSDGQPRSAPLRTPAAPVVGQAASTAIAVAVSTTALQTVGQTSPGELAPLQQTIVVGHNAVVLPTAEEFRADILEAASARTGYPVEMLNEDSLLEADLGIDSIKRIEIFSGLKDKYFMLMQQRERTDEEMLTAFTRLKTLRDIVQAYEEERVVILAGGEAHPARRVEPDQFAALMARSLPMLGEPRRADERLREPDSPPVERFVVRAVEAPPPDGATNARLLPRGQSMLVLGETPEWDVGWRALAMQANTPLYYVLRGAKASRLADDRYEADLASPDSLEELHALLRADGRRIGGIINALGLTGPFDEPGLGENGALELTTALIHVAAEFEDEMIAAIREGGGRLFNLTAFGGKFGLNAAGPLPLAQAGTLGVFKSLAHNWPGARVKNIDLDRRADPNSLLSRLAVEFLGDDAPEIGLTEQGRWRIDLLAQPLAVEEREPLSLDADSVVLLTGGARGVTAAVAAALAQRYACRLVLVGRSPLPGDEAAETIELQDEPSLRRYLVQQALAAAEPATPAEIDRRLQRLTGDREIRRTLRSIARSGATADYRCCDVGDGPRFARLIEQVYEQHGRIDGAIHGAGVIEDRRLGDKTAGSIARVFNTKVNAARVLAETLRPEMLRFLVFFSSVAARFGNAGQADYAAANEYLNKLADQLAAAWPARVVAINWGPWESGMVTPTLARMIRAFNVGLIPLADGVEHCLAELGASSRAAEVVVGCSVERLQRATAEAAAWT